MASAAPAAQWSGEQPRRAQAMVLDAALGGCWRLVPNSAHPEAPGELVPDCGGRHPGNGDVAGAAIAGREASRPAMIRAGDRVTVEESSGRARMRLEGRALDAAAAGQTLRVELGAGQRFAAIADGPGHAHPARTAPSWSRP